MGDYITLPMVLKQLREELQIQQKELAELLGLNAAKEIPIIAMTANSLEEDRKNSKAAGLKMENLRQALEQANS